MPRLEQLRRIRRDAGVTFARQAAVLPFTLALGAVASRLLLPVGYGAFTLATLAVMLVANVAGNGLAVGLIREIGSDQAATRKLTRQALAAAAASGFVLAPLVWFASVIILGAGHRSAAIAAAALPAAEIAAAASGCLAARGLIRRWNLLQLLTAPLPLAGVGVAAFAAPDRRLLVAVCGWVVAQAVCALVWLFAVHPLVRPWLGSALRTGRARAAGTVVVGTGLATIISQLNYRIDMLVLQAFRGSGEVGIYAVAVMLAELVWLASSAFNTPTIEPVISAEDDGEAASLALFGSRLSLMFAAAIALVIAVAAPFAISPLFGSKFAGALVPLLVLLPATVLFAYSKTLSVYVTMRHGNTRLPLMSGVVSCTTTLLLSLPACWQFGVTGAAVASALGYLVGVVVLVRGFVRISGVPVSSLAPRLADLRR